MSHQCVCSLMVLVMVACCGYGLKVDRYNCTFPSGRMPNDAEGGVCIDTGPGDPNRELRCASTSTKTPLLSDGDDTTYYFWRIPAFLNLAIPNNVCVGAIVMTFSNGSSFGIPSLTFAPNEAFTISHDVRPGNLINTTVTFTQQYCGQSVRINMERDGENGIQLTEVTLIEGGGDGSVTETTVATTTTATATMSITTPTGSTSGPGATGEPQYALIGGLAGGGLLIVLLMVIIVVLAVVLFCKRRSREIYSSVSYDLAQVSNGQTFKQEDVYSEPNKQRSFTSTSMIKPSVVDLDNFKKMDQNPIYQHQPGQPQEVPEYAEIPRGSSITSTNLPPVPPPYRPGPSVSPKSTPVPELPDSVDPGFNIYASADNIFQQEEKFEDIYSEPYDLTTFASGGVSGGVDHHIRSPEGASVRLGDDLTPYSSVYAMPAPLDRSEGPMEISSTNIRELKPLGVGQFGEVVLAQTVGLSLKDLKFSKTNNDRSVEISVAVKKLKEDSQTSTREAFEKEIKFMSRLSHRNVIRLLAVCLKGTPFIVMEYMEEGDLNQFLKKRKFSTVPSDYSNTLDIRGLLDIATQIASGMEYLASMKFIHRDLATRNCLVGKNLVVKIADFGMSQNLYSAYYFKLKGRAVLPIRWMAYECFYGRFSVKTDVWAYGVTLWEVFTLGQHQPYEGWTDQEVIENSVKPSRGGESKKLDKPDVCPSEVYHLMLKCWCHESENRPTFKEICRVLKTLNVP